MSFRQWRVAVVVMLSTTILLRGGGVSAHFKSRFFFLPKLRQNIFHSSVTIVINREGWDKNISSYTGGMVDDAKIQQNFFQESKRRCKGYFVVDHLILRGGGG